MYLRNFPRKFVKDGKARLVYYTSEARDLRAFGWVEEDKKTITAKAEQKPLDTKLEIIEAPELQPEPQPEPEQAPDSVTEPVPEVKINETSEGPDFTSMTKAELLQYATDRGVDLANNVLKAELIKACEALK
jgi:hypothetical protein